MNGTAAAVQDIAHWEHWYGFAWGVLFATLVCTDDVDIRFWALLVGSLVLAWFTAWRSFRAWGHYHRASSDLS